MPKKFITQKELRAKIKKIEADNQSLKDDLCAYLKANPPRKFPPSRKYSNS